MDDQRNVDNLSIDVNEAAESTVRPSRLLKRKPAPMALEQRFMFDGAAVATAAVVAEPAPTAEPAPGDSTTTETAAAENDENTLNPLLAVAYAPVNENENETTEASGETEASADEPANVNVQPQLIAGQGEELLSTEAQQIWQQALDEVNRILTDLPNKENFSELMWEVFGNAGTEASDFEDRVAHLVAKLQSGLNIDVEFRSHQDLNGSYAAYAAVGHTGEERIYVNAHWLNGGADEQLIMLVLLEEIGHAFDSHLNAGLDSQGDEGNLFAWLVSGETLSEQQRAMMAVKSDHQTFYIEDVEVLVETAVSGVTIDTTNATLNTSAALLNFTIQINNEATHGADLLVAAYSASGSLIGWQVINRSGNLQNTSFIGIFDFNNNGLTKVDTTGVTLRAWQGTAGSDFGTGNDTNPVITYGNSSSLSGGTAGFRVNTTDAPASSGNATNTGQVSFTGTISSGSQVSIASVNVSIDTIAPVVTDGRISIAGGTGTGGAFKIGDTVTVTWNNTAAGDNNTDTISAVTVNFSQFGGGTAVAATNSGGTWTATYTITSGSIDTTNRNVSVTVTDNAGNSTTVADTTNATVDNIAPTATASITSVVDNVGTITGPLNNGGFTDDTILVLSGSITGTLGTGEVVAVYDGATRLGTATVSGSTWTYTDSTLANAVSYTVRVEDVAGNQGTASAAFTLTIDTVAPTVAISSASYATDSNTIILTGTNFNSLLETSETSATNIVSRLDWSKLIWDINGDGVTSPDVTFVQSDIVSVFVTSATSLRIVLSDTKASALETAIGFGVPGGADKLLVSAGFSVDRAGNVATTDSANVVLSYLDEPKILVGDAGDQVLVGGNNDDVFFGGSGDDTLTGGGGNDVFVMSAPASNGTDVIIDFNAGDQIAFLQGGATGYTWNASGTSPSGENFSTLSAADYIYHTGISTGSEKVGTITNNKVAIISSEMTQSLMTTDRSAQNSNAYLVVYNSTSGFGEIWYSANWSLTSGDGVRYKLVTFSNITSLSSLLALFPNPSTTAGGNERFAEYANPPSINQPPLNNLTITSFVVDEDVNLKVTGISISDPDLPTNSFTITLNVDSGILTVLDNVSNGLTSVGISGNGSSSVTLRGTISAINATLAFDGGLVYRGNLNFNGADTLTILTNDNSIVGGGALTDRDTISITVSAINDAPVVTKSGDNSYTEGVDPNTGISNKIIIDSGITVTDVDVDAPASLVGGFLEVKFINNPKDPLDQLTIYSGASTSLASSVLSTADSISVNNSYGIEVGDQLVLTQFVGSTEVSAIVQVSSKSGNSLGITWVTPRVAFNLYDPDLYPNNGAVSVVELARLFYVDETDGKVYYHASAFGEDIRNVGDHVGTVVSDGKNGNNLKITFTAEATLPIVNLLAQNIAFSNESSNPIASPRQIQFTVDDGGNVGGSSLSGFADVTVTFGDVNDAPVPITRSASVFLGQPVVLSASNLLVSDTDTPSERIVFAYLGSEQGGNLQFLDGSTWTDMTLSDGSFVGSLGNADGYFTQADINAGKIRYLAPDDVDNGVVLDGVNLVVVDLAIDLTPERDPITVVLAVTLNELSRDDLPTVYEDGSEVLLQPGTDWGESDVQYGVYRFAGNWDELSGEVAENVASQASTELAADVDDDAATIISVNPSHNLAVGDLLEIGGAPGVLGELVRIEGISDSRDTLTVARGQLGTDASAHGSGATVNEVKVYHKAYGDVIITISGTAFYVVDSTRPEVQQLAQDQEVTEDFTLIQGSKSELSVQVGNGSSPLTSGRDQVSYFTPPPGALTADTQLTIFTDFQQSPFTTPIPGGEVNTYLYGEVEARIVVGGSTFIAVLRSPLPAGGDDGRGPWEYDAGTGLMKTTVSFSEILLATGSSRTGWSVDPSGKSLADFFDENLISGQWAVVYDDNTPGNYQARYATFNFSTAASFSEQVVTLRVVGVNDAPNISVESGDSAAKVLTESDERLTVSDTLTLKDIDVRDVVSVAVTNVSVSGTYLGTNTPDANTLLGFLTVNGPSFTADPTDANGNISWTFDSGTEAFNFLRDGQTLILTYTLVATDDSLDGATDSQTVTITIVGTSDLPILGEGNGVDEGAANEDVNVTGAGKLVISGRLTVDDPDDEQSGIDVDIDPVVVVVSDDTATTPPTVAFGELTIDEDGNWTYQIDNTRVQYLGAGQTRTEIFEVRTLDGTPARITIVITGVDDGFILEDRTENRRITEQEIGGRTVTVTSGNLGIIDINTNPIAQPLQVIDEENDNEPADGSDNRWHTGYEYVWQVGNGWVDVDRETVTYSLEKVNEEDEIEDGVDGFGNPTITLTLANGGGTLILNTVTGAYTYTPGTKAVDIFPVRATAGSETRNLLLTFDSGDTLDRDGVPASTETTLANQGGGVLGDLNGDGVPDEQQNAVTTLSWIKNENFVDGINGDSVPTPSIISLIVQAPGATPGQLDDVDATAQLTEVKVLQPTDALIGGSMPVSLNGQTVEAPWDPIQFAIEPLRSSGLLDADGDPTNGIQVRVVIDISRANLDAGYFNAYLKYVTVDPGFPQTDLDGKLITQSGWYDFTRRQDRLGNYYGDGAVFVVVGGKITAIELYLTDNAFGDNDPTINRIYDPGLPVFIRPVQGQEVPPQPYVDRALPRNPFVPTEVGAVNVTSPGASFIYERGLRNALADSGDMTARWFGSQLDLAAINCDLSYISWDAWGVETPYEGYLTSDGDKAFRIMVTECDAQALAVFRGVADQQLTEDGQVYFAVAADAFVHTDLNAIVKLRALLVNGEALPDWLVFDAETGMFIGVPPEGSPENIAVRVIARDQQGREASVVFRINLRSQVVQADSGRAGFAEQMQMAARQISGKQLIAA